MTTSSTCRACRASRARRDEHVEQCCTTSSTKSKCNSSTRRTCRVETWRDEPRGIWALLKLQLVDTCVFFESRCILPTYCEKCERNSLQLSSSEESEQSNTPSHRAHGRMHWTPSAQRKSVEEQVADKRNGRNMWLSKRPYCALHSVCPINRFGHS